MLNNVMSKKRKSTIKALIAASFIKAIEQEKSKSRIKQATQ